MTVTRRALLRSGTLLGTAAVVGLPSISRAAVSPASPVGTTLAGRLVRGTPGTGGYARLVAAAGEPHVVRADLGASPGDARATDRQAVVSFVHLTDVHVIDAQSPMRVEYLDRLDDAYAPGDPTLGGLLTSSYRPQEMLTAQTSDAMVRAVNDVAAAPVTGSPLAFAIQTGDNSDNCQYNEVRWNIDVLDGGRPVRPDSGSTNRWEGVHDSGTADTHYWHPEGGRNDQYRSRYGFPAKNGLLDAARRPFTPEGLSMPWYSVFGNHDGLVQGNFPQTLPLGLIGTGPLKATSLPPGLSQADVIDALRTANATPLLGALSLLSARLVSADPARRSLTRKQVVDEHFKTSGSPVGHGFTAQNRAKGTAYYTFDQGPLRCVVLDTVNPNGYADGSIDAAQHTWLQQVLAASTDRFVMVFSHHTSATMTNPLVVTGLDLQPRVLGPAVVSTLLASPNVVAWVNGHTHKNAITAHARPDGSGGFYEMSCASHVDFPQQSRLVELADNRDGTLSIFTTMVDHAGAAQHSGLASTVELASLSRELAANDPQQRTAGYEGKASDRNTELVLPNPLG